MRVCDRDFDLKPRNSIARGTEIANSDMTKWSFIACAVINAKKNPRVRGVYVPATNELKEKKEGGSTKSLPIAGTLGAFVSIIANKCIARRLKCKTLNQVEKEENFDSARSSSDLDQLPTLSWETLRTIRREIPN